MSTKVDPSKEFGDEIADEGSLFVCCMCGKYSKHLADKTLVVAIVTDPVTQ